MGLKFEDKDLDKSYYWYEKGHKLGDNDCTACLATLILDNEEKTFSQSRQNAVTLLTLAAERGSDYAAFNLGYDFIYGERGFTKNENLGKVWLRKCLEYDRTILKDEHAEEAQELLAQDSTDEEADEDGSQDAQ